MDYYEEVTKLPDRFAEEVLELEIKVEAEECDLSTIQRLNELYRVMSESHVDRHRVLHRDRYQEGHTLPEKANTASNQSHNPAFNR